jgi:hypothetical protein
VTTIFPTCSPASMKRWASAIWSKGKVRAIVGWKAPSARPALTNCFSAASSCVVAGERGQRETTNGQIATEDVEGRRDGRPRVEGAIENERAARRCGLGEGGEFWAADGVEDQLGALAAGETSDLCDDLLFGGCDDGRGAQVIRFR